MRTALWIVRMALMYAGIALYAGLIFVWYMASTACREAHKAVEEFWQERKAHEAHRV